MKPFLAASPNPFDLKAALLAGHAQHPVIIHFPIALFIASAVFEVLALWRKQPVFASVAYYNLVGAALTVPLAIATGLGAWQWQLTAPYDLRADFGVVNLRSLLDALPPPREGNLAGYHVFRSDVPRVNGDHAHWTSRWNTQRR
jgi:hypothetical protein